jgi:hypothetical protein
MSDYWITLVPEEPRHVPDESRQRLAQARFKEIVPEADEVELKIFDRVTFFDCGENFERIQCPSCGAEISVEWWQDRMDEDDEDGFRLDAYATPCCGKRSTLNDLVYDWPQAFGRFALEAMNPNLGELDDSLKREFEQLLGTRLRIVYQHI